MAKKFNGVEYAFPDTNAHALNEIAGISIQDMWDLAFSNLVLRANGDNSGNIYFGNEDVSTTDNRGGYLAKGEGLTINCNPGWFDAHGMFLVAETAQDIVHVAWII